MSDGETTVNELVQFIDRSCKALCEAGRPELAERAHVVVLASGAVRLSFREPSSLTGDADVEKFLTLDPVFKKGDT